MRAPEPLQQPGERTHVRPIALLLGAAVALLVGVPWLRRATGIVGLAVEGECAGTN